MGLMEEHLKCFVLFLLCGSSHKLPHDAACSVQFVGDFHLEKCKREDFHTADLEVLLEINRQNDKKLSSASRLEQRNNN